MLLGAEKSQVFKTCRMKIYPEYIELMACDKAIFGGGGWESRDVKKDAAMKCPTPRAGTETANLERATRRARSKLRDYALCNGFSHFVTLTVDQTRADRYDEPGLVRRMTKWMDNQFQHHGVQMLVIPEHHKDGAVHFHGLAKGILTERLFDSGTVKLATSGKPRKPRSQRQRAQWISDGGKIVYNWPSWTLGYSTVMELYGQYGAAVNYVCKYIGKDVKAGGGKIGGRWYYQSGKLALPEEGYMDLGIREVLEMGGRQFDIPEAGLSFAVVQVPKSPNGDKEEI